MSASWDSDLPSIIEKTNNNLKLLRKTGDKPHVAVTAVSHRPRAFVGVHDDTGSTSSRGSARPVAFVRNEDDTSSMGSHGSARPRAYIRRDEDSFSSNLSARVRAFVPTDDDSVLNSSRGLNRPKAYFQPDDDMNSATSRASARPKAFIRPDDDSASISSRASARPKAFVRGDDDTNSMASRASARPKAFIRNDDDTNSMASRASARPKAFVRNDDDVGSMSSNSGLNSSRVDLGSSFSRPHVGIAGGGGLTAAMLQQHRAAGNGAGPTHFEMTETRSINGMSARLRDPHGTPHAQLHRGPRIRVPEADIPSDLPHHVLDELRRSLETHFASRNSAVDKKVSDLRTDIVGLTTQMAAMSSQVSELRDAVVAMNKSSPTATSVANSKILSSIQANATAIARLEENSAVFVGQNVSSDRELTELGSQVKTLSFATMKISSLEDNMEALVANSQNQEQGMFQLTDQVQLMHRQMENLIDIKTVEDLVSIRLTRGFREMEDRLAQNVMLMADKLEQKVQISEKQSTLQRQESLAALKSDLTDEMQRLQGLAVRKSDLLPLQNAQVQSKEEVAHLSAAIDRQDKELQVTKSVSATLRDELGDARAELNKALQSQQHSVAVLMEKKLMRMVNESKENSIKFDDKLSELAKKQNSLEDATKVLQETMDQLKEEASQRLRSSSIDREEENEKLRQRLARSVAELETMASTKDHLDVRFASEESQLQSRLKELRTALLNTEKQRETQCLELVQKLQEESKLMGIAQGKNILLESLLAREKNDNYEKNESMRFLKEEATEVREKIRKLESDNEKLVHQLTLELHAKQVQVSALSKTLNCIETASAKGKATAWRREKATTEHKLVLAQLKLEEMERVALILPSGDEEQANITAASIDERKELEELLLQSQLEKDELEEELEMLTNESNAARERLKDIVKDTNKLSSAYDKKICELEQQINDREQAMRQLSDTLGGKCNLDALEDELGALKDEKSRLLDKTQRVQIEYERIALDTETNLRLEHATELATIKSKLEDSMLGLESAKFNIAATKVTVRNLEKELETQNVIDLREALSLRYKIKDARGKSDACTKNIVALLETKTRLEGKISRMEANIGNESAEKKEKLATIKDQLRLELAEVSSTLEKEQVQLQEAMQSDESNRHLLIELAMAQEEIQSRVGGQIGSQIQKLSHERESSLAREEQLKGLFYQLNADKNSLKSESNGKIGAESSTFVDEMNELTTMLEASQHREQQLQSRLKRVLDEFEHAANTLGGSKNTEETKSSNDEVVTRECDALYASHERTVRKLNRLQAKYELDIKQATADVVTAQKLDNQIKAHEIKIEKLESVAKQIHDELKEQYHVSAIIAKGSDEFSEEMASIRDQKRKFERQLQELEKVRAKREVSYQQNTKIKEREAEELCHKNRILTAAISSLCEKIRAIENDKSQDLSELKNKLKDLDERTLALQPSESKRVNLENDFVATRQEVMMLTAEIQSLYQKLTKCCSIAEWSELRSSIFDEEDELMRVCSEHTYALAKAQSTESDVLTNAEFLNALLVAHSSPADEGNAIDDRWMQKFALITPETVERLRRVESRLRDAVLDLHHSASVFHADAIVKDSTDEISAHPPRSQSVAVDDVVIALALEKANEDYFSETSETAHDLDDNDVKIDGDQPDMEQEFVGNEEGNKP
ncbi:hypothetical protein CCR75_009184 [Bremia lactucae]|uniref:Uncharacterized protein n=1 Tax=Bremia lactucae TaxID=4779 RepID=A0A976ICV6_BRELC|nr:hypothetical protein CCR75_009184 [Bremia lactucae]